MVRAHLDVAAATKRAWGGRASPGRSLLELAEGPRFRPYVDALAMLKGADAVVALAYVSTVDDFSRIVDGELAPPSAPLGQPPDAPRGQRLGMCRAGAQRTRMCRAGAR